MTDEPAPPPEFPTVPPGTTVCPGCGGKLVRILYGLASLSGFADAERGEAVLGGCLVSGADPNLQCLGCGQRYRIQAPA
jgi:hypothetical protein